jgi:hypothetical protein
MLRYLFLFAGLFIIMSCSPKLRPFTYQMYSGSGWSESELRRIQFYVSNDIVLQRRLDGSRARIQGGTIRIIDGSQYEEVIIRRGTPGVYAFSPDQDKIAISFEEPKDKFFLVFTPSQKLNGQYVLAAQRWDRDQGFITYAGQTYVTPARSAFAILQVDVRGKDRTTVKTRSAGGARVRR